MKTISKKYPPLNVRAFQGVAHIFKTDITEAQIKKFWNYVGTILITAFLFGIVPISFLDLQRQEINDLRRRLEKKKTLEEIVALGKFIIRDSKGSTVYIVGPLSEYPDSVSGLTFEIQKLKSDLFEVNKKLITAKTIAESALNKASRLEEKGKVRNERN